MAGAVSLDTRSVSVAPGQEAAVTVRIRNLGQVVDGFVVDVLGEPAGWSYADPPEIRLFPNTDGVVVVRFKPAAEKGPVAGPHPFAVRVQSREDVNWVAIEEATVEVSATVNISAEIRPKTSSGRRKGKHQVIIDNHSNTPAVVQVIGDDADDLLDFRIEPADVTLPPGKATIVDLRAKLVSKPPTGTARVPFVVNVLAGGQPAASTEGAFAPRKIPWKPLLVLAVALVGAVIALMVFTDTDITTGTISGQDTEPATTASTVPGETTTTPPAGEDTTTTEGENGGEDVPVAQRLEEPQVLVATDSDGDLDIVLANLDGSDAVALTDNDVADIEPAASPDGTKLVFVSGDPSANTDLFLLDLEECIAGDLDTCEPEALTDTPQPEGSPDWSPDGEQVVFSRNTTFGTRAVSNVELVMLTVESGDEVQLTSQPGDDIKPQFSPDGNLLTFERQSGTGRDLAVFDIRGLTVRPVGGTAGFFSPHWVDNDTVVAMRPAGAESSTIVEIDVNNLTRRPVPRDLFTEVEVDLLDVSPDGARILMVLGGTDLIVADRNGDNRNQVTDDLIVFNGELFEP